MKSIRTLVACGVLASVVTTGARERRVAASAPVQSPPGALERQAKPITPENPVPRRINFEAPLYPADAAAAGARGTVTLTITLDAAGQVAEARRTRVLVMATNPPVSVTLGGATPEDEARFLVNGSREQSDSIRAIAKALTDEAIRSVMLWRYDPPAVAPIAFPVSVTLGPPAGAAPLPSMMTATSVTDVDAPVRVGSHIRTPAKVVHVNPVYPAEAQAQRVMGMVIIEATIGRDGRVTNATVLRSIPLLDEAAINAVRQWEFTPTLLNGVPVPVIMTVTVNFTLSRR